MRYLIFLIALVMMPYHHLYGRTTLKMDQKKGAIPTKQESDTLRLGYTYWWPQSGPFIGNCSTSYALVVVGTVVDLETQAQDTLQLRPSKRGVIRVEEVLTKRELPKASYTTQSYLQTEGFDGSNVRKGDQIVLFCYEYEGGYVTPGHKSILKVSGIQDPIVISIKKYIAAGQRASAIQQDIKLWESYELREDVERHLNCEDVVKNQNTTNHERKSE